MAELKQVQKQVEDNTKTLDTIKQDLHTLRHNHLWHIERDMETLKKTIDKMDTRMWAILILLVTSVLAGMFGDKIFNLL